MFIEQRDSRPLCKEGVASQADLATLERALIPMQPRPAEFAAVTFGRLVLELSTGERVVIRPVFNQAKYDLVKVDRDSGPQDAAATPALASLLQSWRLALSSDASVPLMDCASGESSFEPSWPPWHAYFALLPVLFVPGSLVVYLVTRLPCPRCSSNDTKNHPGETYWELTCARCNIRWDTRVRVARRGSGDNFTHDHHHHHHHH